MMDTPSSRSPGSVAANVRAALSLLAVERGDAAVRIAAGLRAILRGDHGDEAREALADAWDDAEVVLRRHARRIANDALFEASGRTAEGPASPFAAPRLRMVRDQIVAHGVDDPRVVRAMLETPREAFVPGAHRDSAHDDRPLPIGSDQTISQPFIVAFMTQALALRGDERVLEVGTGSGYQAAILARTAREVWSIEVREPLSRRAGETLGQLGIGNVRLRVGDGRAGWPEAAPYDAVMLTCAPAAVPPALPAQLRADGGRLVAPVGDDPDRQDLVRITRTPDGFREERLLAVRFVPMTGGL